METIPQILTFLGLAFMIFLIITIFKMSSTIAELRSRVMSLEETLDSKNKEIKHKRDYIDVLQTRIQSLENYQYMPQAPAPEIKAYKSVKLQAETGRDASENISRYYIKEEIIKNIDDFIEYEKLGKNKYRGTLTVYKKDE